MRSHLRTIQKVGQAARTILLALTSAIALVMGTPALALAATAAPAVGAAGHAPTVHIWASGVNVRRGGNACNNNPSTVKCPDIVTHVGVGSYPAVCQQSGETIHYGGYASTWWTWIRTRGTAGFVSNVFLTGPAHMPNVPNCTKSTPVHVWAPGVNVRSGGAACDRSPSITGCSDIVTHVNPGSYPASCQQPGENITYDGYSSNWWTRITAHGTTGFVSNVFLSGPARMPNVPTCSVPTPPPPSANCGTTNNCTPGTFATAVLRYSGIRGRLTSANSYAFMTWERAEGGNWNNSASCNPVNTTLHEPGSTPIFGNPDGVQAYHSGYGHSCWYWGIKATGDTLLNGYYGGILHVLRYPAASRYRQCVDLAHAVGSSPWGTGDFAADC